MLAQLKNCNLLSAKPIFLHAADVFICLEPLQEEC